jgi:hypothetical protein
MRRTAEIAGAKPKPTAGGINRRIRGTLKTAFMPVRLPRIRRIPRFLSSGQLLAACKQSGLLQRIAEKKGFSARLCVKSL